MKQRERGLSGVLSNISKAHGEQTDGQKRIQEDLAFTSASPFTSGISDK